MKIVFFVACTSCALLAPAMAGFYTRGGATKDGQQQHEDERGLGSPACFTCAGNNPCDGNQLYFAHCHPEMFIQCDEWGGCYERDCRPGTFWNDLVTTCAETATMKCPTCDYPCEPGTASFEPHCSDEEQFIQCDENGLCFERLCAPGTNWNEAKEGCDTPEPSAAPSESPSSAPSESPSSAPSNSPSSSPSATPSSAPSETPSSAPSESPSSTPSGSPSSAPSESPSSTPSNSPSSTPSYSPSSTPSNSPSSTPSDSPSSSPSKMPTANPTPAPVPAPTPRPTPPPFPCFRGDSVVEVLDENQVDTQMIEVKDLKLGDKVKCVSLTSRTLSYCTMIFHYHPSFLPVDPVTGAPFLTIEHDLETQQGSITMSGNHMLYVANPTVSTAGDIIDEIPEFDPTFGHFPTASEVQAGDLVAVVYEPDPSKMIIATVTVINKNVSYDAYAPVVDEGGLIVVDNTVASSFVIDDNPFNDTAVEEALRLIPAALALPTAHYFQSTLFVYFLPVFQDAMTSVFGLTRDDSNYIAWEAGNYFLPLQFSESIINASGQCTEEGYELTAEYAILWNKQVINDTVNNITRTPAEKASLFYDACVGNLTVD